jgi:hypothetical protein
MTDHAWKAFERTVADLFGGRRYWANSGEAIDVEGPTVIAQCKHVARMSLEHLSQLAEVSEKQGTVKQKTGVVAVKVRRGHGRHSPILIVMTEAMWRFMNGPSTTRRPEEFE